MTFNRRGFTIIEVLTTVAIIGIASAIAVPMGINIYDDFALKTTANEIKNALFLTQQLSIDESRTYAFEVFNDIFRIREDRLNSKIIYSQNLKKNISLVSSEGEKITYNRHGATGYGYFILNNRQQNKIKVEVMIGTGRVRLTEVD